MIKNIGFETSSIMPLLEITTRTLPLQQYINKVIDSQKINFYTDLYSVNEALQQIDTSFDNAMKSIEKTKIVAKQLNIENVRAMPIIFIKSLSENWYGREETLRWADIFVNDKFEEIQNFQKFYEILNQQMKNKREKYHSMLNIENEYLVIDCKNIQSYWITPSFIKDLKIKIKVIPNTLSPEDFFKKLQSTINTAYMKKLRINDVMDIYHLYSLYNDGDIREVWSCNQRFVKEHEKYLKTVKEFRDLFNKNVVTIRRIKKK